MNASVLLNITNTGIANIILNRPEKHNAFDDSLIQEFITILEKLPTDVRIILLNASGKNFCAGADLAWMQRMVNYSHAENLRDAAMLARLLKLLNGINLPTVALAHGAVYGGGIGLLSCCDIVIATQNTHFCFF